MILHISYNEEFSNLKLIDYGIHPTPFGTCLIAILEQRVCGVYFVIDESIDSLLLEIKSNWNPSHLVHNQTLTQPYVEQIFESKPSVSLHVKGTPFQCRVWKTLLSVSFGSSTHYEALATKAGYPAATRAVASAVASNPISILVPCHRVLYKSGKVGNYRWGSSIKRALLTWEESVLATSNS